MQTEDPQKTWSDYYQRKKRERVREAVELWKQMQRAGVVETTVLALDFVHFGNSQTDVEALASQLSENYTMQVVRDDNQNYWYAKGTTRPQGLTLSQEQHMAWVEFMSDVAQSHACVFSTWSLEAPSLRAKFHSEHIESDS